MVVALSLLGFKTERDSYLPGTRLDLKRCGCVNLTRTA